MANNLEQIVPQISKQGKLTREDYLNMVDFFGTMTIYAGVMAFGGYMGHNIQEVCPPMFPDSNQLVGYGTLAGLTVSAFICQGAAEGGFSLRNKHNKK